MRPGRWPKTFADDHAPGRPAAQRLGDERCVGAEEGHRRHQATSSSANPSPSTSAGRSDALAALGSPVSGGVEAAATPDRTSSMTS